MYDTKDGLESTLVVLFEEDGENLAKNGSREQPALRTEESWVHSHVKISDKCKVGQELIMK